MKWNLEEKPEKCQDTDCNNKAFGINRITPMNFYWVCRKHYYMYNFGK